MTLENPYKPGRYVTDRQFYGRQAILQTLEHEDYRGAYIIGTRQIGKTSLLREMECRLPAFYMDVSYLGRQLPRWARSLGRSIARKRPIYTWLPDPTIATTVDFFELLEQVAYAAEDNEQTVWLLLDEAEDLMHLSEVQPNFLARLRGATEMLPSLRLTVAGYRSLLELRQTVPPFYPSPLLGGFISFILPPLSNVEATALICQDQTTPGVEVEETTINEILIEAGGHPFLLQRLCNYLWQAGKLRSPDETFRHRISTDAENVFPADFELLSDLEQQILLFLSQQKEAFFAAIEATLKNIHLSKCLQDLVELGFLYRTSTGYAISNQILFRWLANLDDSHEIPAPISNPTLIELRPVDEQEKQLEELLKTHLDNLSEYEKIKARYGFDVPLHIINGLKYEQEAIQKLQQELENLRQRRKEERKMPADPYSITWSLMVLGKASEFLFNQAGELLKERREKRKKTAETTASPSSETDERPISDSETLMTTLEEQLSQLEKRAALATSRIEIQKVDSLIKQLEDYNRNKLMYEEEAAKLPGVDDQIRIQRRIEETDDKVAQKAGEMRQLLEKLSQRKIHIPALDE